MDSVTTAASIVSRIQISDEFFEFAVRAYANHDTAHNFTHAMTVYKNALYILESEIAKGTIVNVTEEELIEFPYAIIGHDFRDHKLIEHGLCLSSEEITAFYQKHLPSEESVQKILHIHDNCSWSNRIASVPLKTGDWMRRVLQDADWLEALGQTGLDRCAQFKKFRNPNITEFESNSITYDHIMDKLLKIPSELNYETSRQIVRDKLLLFPLIRFSLNHEAIDPSKEHTLFKSLMT